MNLSNMKEGLGSDSSPNPEKDESSVVVDEKNGSESDDPKNPVCDSGKLMDAKVTIDVVKVKEERSDFEVVEFEVDDENVRGGRRVRKRRRTECEALQSECNGIVGVGKKIKEEGLDGQGGNVVRILRSRTVGTSTTEKKVEKRKKGAKRVEKTENALPIGRPGEDLGLKLTKKRGRPRKDMGAKLRTRGRPRKDLGVKLLVKKRGRPRKNMEEGGISKSLYSVRLGKRAEDIGLEEEMLTVEELGRPKILPSKRKNSEEQENEDAVSDIQSLLKAKSEENKGHEVEEIAMPDKIPSIKSKEMEKGFDDPSLQLKSKRAYASGRKKRNAGKDIAMPADLPSAISEDLENEDVETLFSLKSEKRENTRVKKKRNKGKEIAVPEAPAAKTKKRGGKVLVEKNLIREQIKNMLLQSGWAIDYRPRMNKDYNDAVYVSPKGREFWSVTLAYKVLKEQVENGEVDGSTFTPIPDEVISKLFRVTKKSKERKMEMKFKQIVADDSRMDKDDIKRVPKSKPTQGDSVMLGDNSTKRKMKGKFLSPGRNNQKSTSRKGKSVNSSDAHAPRQQKGRNRCTLLARHRSENGMDQGFDTEKRSVLVWMINMGTVPLNAQVQYMNHRRKRTMLEGIITRDGILCSCCGDVLTIQSFEIHAGSKLGQPFQNMYLESGASLLQCLLDSWNRQRGSDREGFHLIPVDGDDPNDDTCGICGDGGDLVCCDGCPSTFHQNCLDIENFPSGEWLCIYCSCKFCGMANGETCNEDANDDKTHATLLACSSCDHQICIQVEDAIHDDSNSLSFCGKKCQEIFQRLELLLGVKQEIGGGFSWTLIRRSDVSPDVSLNDQIKNIEGNSKLAVAFSVMDECFSEIIDPRCNINLIRSVLYNCGSNFHRINYSHFFTAILERDDEIISAASIRIHGSQVAEMPFIGTRHNYRRQGMCRRLLSAVESVLCSLNVEKLVIPAITELMDTWTSIFGFKPLEALTRQEMTRMNLVVFHGTDMLQKPLLKHQLDEVTPDAGLSSTKLGKELCDEENTPDMLSPNGPDIVKVIDEPAVESNSQCPDSSLHDTSDVTSEIFNNTEVPASKDYVMEQCDNLNSENNTFSDPQLSRHNSCEKNPKDDAEETGESDNNGPGWSDLIPAEINTECNSKLEEQGSEMISKSVAVACLVPGVSDSDAKIADASSEGAGTVAGKVQREINSGEDVLNSHATLPDCCNGSSSCQHGILDCQGGTCSSNGAKTDELASRSDHESDVPQISVKSPFYSVPDCQADKSGVLQYHSESFCNPTAVSGVPLLCASGGCNAGGILKRPFFIVSRMARVVGAEGRAFWTY
ncbi:Zinc finger, PHD-finger [Dillenia turbinata]|uniref:Zinc finger, PHD-finger n=1 Tax=Dillenia turbinata TaxID=194707 RepID=A0AAN8ZH50_9MAGN